MGGSPMWRTWLTKAAGWLSSDSLVRDYLATVALPCLWSMARFRTVRILQALAGLGKSGDSSHQHGIRQKAQPREGVARGIAVFS
jgi:hypothetical protein